MWQKGAEIIEENRIDQNRMEQKRREYSRREENRQQKRTKLNRTELLLFCSGVPAHLLSDSIALRSETCLTVHYNIFNINVFFWSPVLPTD